MFYGYDSTTGYVRAIWATAPTEDERRGLEVLEVAHELAPTDGYWRIESGVLIEIPGTFAEFERRRARIAARRARRPNPDLVRRLNPATR